MKRSFILISILVLLLTCSLSIHGQSRISTAEDRAALADYIIAKTKIRAARSPIKEQVLGFDPIEEMMAVKSEVVNASSEEELYYALMKLSAARRDRHLSIDQVEGGLQLPPIEEGTAPIRFHPDYSEDEYFLFVSDLGADIGKHTNKTPSIGDKLLTINGMPADEYMAEVKQYTRHSNLANFWRRTAYGLSEKSDNLPASFYGSTLQLTLEDEEGTWYDIDLPYLEEVDWQYGRRVITEYPGYELAWETDSFHLHIPTDPANKTIVLWWYGFRSDLQEATDRLVDYAAENDMLDYNIIIDGIDSRGGSQGAYALARMSPKPFITTDGNLKLSDITDDFIAGYTERYLSEKSIMDGESVETDNGKWVMDWFHGPVLQGLADGQAYSNNTPFKCAHLPHYSDWVMQPAAQHFSGKLAIMLGPWGGSHLSQFAAMIIDNDLGYAIAMPDGGYSNTWEWSEVLRFPISGQPVVEFMWNIGHTIRPNGQILEGNPPAVDEFIPVTKDNYLIYKKELLKKAEEWVSKR